MSRRYREAGANNELFPDVILIDGGLGQLHAAMEAFTTMDVKPPMVISLAKKEEMYIQAKASRPNCRGPMGLKLLQHIRDEAHRFGQSYHHLLISKAPAGGGNHRRQAPPAKPRRKKQNPAVPKSEQMQAQPARPGPDPDFKVLTAEEIKKPHASAENRITFRGVATHRVCDCRRPLRTRESNADAG